MRKTEEQKLSNQMAKNTKVFLKNADKGSAYRFLHSGDIGKMRTAKEKEKRRAKRTALGYAYIDVYPAKLRGKSEFRGKIHDISPLGAKFVSCKPYDISSTVYLGLLLPSHGALLDVTGRVVRCEEKEKEEYHVAVEFGGDSYQRSMIKDYIKLMKLRDKHIRLNVSITKTF